MKKFTKKDWQIMYINILVNVIFVCVGMISLLLYYGIK